MPENKTLTELKVSIPEERESNINPERNLMAAMLNRALLDSMSRNARTKKDALEYINEEAPERPLSFEYCCLVLDLNPIIVRSLKECAYELVYSDSYRSKIKLRSGDYSPPDLLPVPRESALGYLRCFASVKRANRSESPDPPPVLPRSL